MTMSSKGISPLIAAVLLIAFTMAVASLFAQWAPTLMENAQGNTANRSQQIQECARYGIDIVSANATSATISQNNGPEGMGSLVTTWRFNNSAPEQDRSGTIDKVQGITTVAWNQTNQEDKILDEVEAVSESCQTVQAVYDPAE